MKFQLDLLQKLIRACLSLVCVAGLNGLTSRSVTVYDDDASYLYSYYYFYETRNQLGELIFNITKSYTRSSHTADGVMTITENYPRYGDPKVRREYYYADEGTEPDVERDNFYCQSALATLQVISTQGLDIHVVNPGSVRIWRSWTEIPQCGMFGTTWTTYTVTSLQNGGWVTKQYTPFNAMIEGFWVTPN